MPWLVDGSNLLGAMRVDRHAEDAKRYLTGRLAAFARQKRTKVTLFFDGPEPGSFARSLGAVTVVFSGPRPADDLIVDRARQGRGWSVVTDDRQIAAKVAGRHVEIVPATRFVIELEALQADEPGRADDWETWFADPKNRADF
jgi:hypothetical protein